jgi:protein SCO1
MRALVLIGVVLAVAVAGSAAVLLESWGSGSSGVTVADDSDGPYRGSDVPAGTFLPSFSLRSYTGELVRTKSLHGKVALVTFLESKCQQACPVIAAEIAQGLALLTTAERRQVAAVAVSTHPGDDTPSSVREFVRRHRLAGRLDYLIGSERELRPVWRKFHILSALESGNADIHSAPVRVFDPEGEWVTTLHSGVDLTPRNLAHDVREALR